MRREPIEAILRGLGCQRISYAAASGWVRSTCPLASSLHASGRDRSPSFAVMATHPGVSYGRCLACGFKGPLISVLWLQDQHGYPVEHLMRILQENEVPDFDVAEPPTMLDRLKRASVYTDPPVNRTNRSLEKWREDLRKQQVLSEDDLARNAQLPAWVRKHLKEERGLDDLTILTWELGYNASRNRLVVPIRNKDGALVGMSGRAMGKAQPKYLHSKGFRRDLVLYGEHRLLDSQRGYLHEGFFAVQSATMRGYTNSVARMGTHLSEAQADLIIHTFTDLVIVPDGDQPGFESAQQIAEQLQNRITVTVAPMPQGSEVETLSNADALKILGPLPSSLTTP